MEKSTISVQTKIYQYQQVISSLTFFAQTNTEKVYAHRIARFDDPNIRVGEDNYIPDVVVEYSNGREKIIEVDSKPLRAKDRRQHKAFQRSENHVSNRSYEHRFTQNILED